MKGKLEIQGKKIFQSGKRVSSWNEIFYDYLKEKNF